MKQRRHIVASRGWMKLAARSTPAMLVMLCSIQSAAFAQSENSGAAKTNRIADNKTSPSPAVDRSVSSAGPSEGRFNSMLALGAVTAYGFKSDNRTLQVGGAVATALAYKKWSRRRTRLRSDEYQNRGTTMYGDLSPEEEEYEFRKGRGDTALALAVVPAFGLATGRRTFVVAGGVATGLAYRRYRQTRREKKADEAQRQAATEIRQ